MLLIMFIRVHVCQWLYQSAVRFIQTYVMMQNDQLHAKVLFFMICFLNH